MAVRSEPIEKKRRKPSPAVLSKGGVIGAMIWILRIIALILMVASTFGNYVQFMGGWPPEGKTLALDFAVAGVAFAYQIILSLLQWGFKAGQMWIPYAIVLIASAIPSFLTYNALLGPYLATQVGDTLALLGIGIAMLGADALPEWVLVE